MKRDGKKVCAHMTRKLLPFLLLCLLALSGCDGDDLSDKQRRQAINEVGAVYGLKFGEARGDIPRTANNRLLYNMYKVIERPFLEEIICNSLQETQLLHNRYSIFDLPIVPIGNRVDGSMLSGDTWTVYCIPYRLDWENHAEAMRRKMDLIRNDFLFLLEHHFSASDIR